jgi:hypothetical protein
VMEDLRHAKASRERSRTTSKGEIAGMGRDTKHHGPIALLGPHLIHNGPLKPLQPIVLLQ